MAELKIVTASLGAFHAAAITSTGEVYTWGKGLAGQLGHEEVKSEVIISSSFGIIYNFALSRTLQSQSKRLLIRK